MHTGALRRTAPPHCQFTKNLPAPARRSSFSIIFHLPRCFSFSSRSFWAECTPSPFLSYRPISTTLYTRIHAYIHSSTLSSVRTELLIVVHTKYRLPFLLISRARARAFICCIHTCEVSVGNRNANISASKMIFPSFTTLFSLITNEQIRNSIKIRLIENSPTKILPVDRWRLINNFVIAITFHE